VCVCVSVYTQNPPFNKIVTCSFKYQLAILRRYEFKVTNHKHLKDEYQNVSKCHQKLHIALACAKDKAIHTDLTDI